jgi:ketosteroid isomerase-like protein
MKRIIFFLFTGCIVNVFGQNIQQEINQQVWKPFIQTFNDHDTKAFMALHSKDVVRSPRDSKAIWNWEEYNQQQSKGDERGKSSNVKHQLELRFTERIANKNLAIDVGIYKTTVIRSDGIGQSYYGRFHVVLRKENGTWKILVDTDSTEGNTISEKDFLAAQPME